MGNVHPLGLPQDNNLDRVEKAFPGFKSAIEKIRRYEISSEEYDRQFLQSIQNVPGFKTAFNGLSDEYKERLIEFTNGKSAKEITKSDLRLHSDQHITQSYALVGEPDHIIDSETEEEENVYIYDGEDQSKPLVMYKIISPENGNGNFPAYIYIPTTVAGIQNIILNLAIGKDKRVRVADSRHSWSIGSSKKPDILISLFTPSSSSETWPTEFNQIEIDSEDVPGSDGEKRRVRVGAAVTNEEFRVWSIKNGWTFPSNVRLFGPFLCYGIAHGVTSDLVREVEYVDAEGNHQKISDSQHIEAIADSLGLLGIITHISFELERMTYAVLHPIKQDLLLAIPPPSGYNIPPGVEVSLSDYPQQLLEDAGRNFTSMARWDYSEWSWTPFSKKVCVNCWWTTDDPSDVQDYPDPAETFRRWGEDLASGILNEELEFKLLTGRLQARINGEGAMSSLQPRHETSEYPLKTHVINVLNDPHEIQNQWIQSLELLFPIPALSSNPEKPDWEVLQRAWWDTITLFHADLGGGMRVGLNMRIINPSNSIMEPESNNKFGTASIKISTNTAAVEDYSWQPFAQKIIDTLSGYEVNGRKLKVRPNWATEFEELKIHGENWRKHLKEVSHKEEIENFKNILSSIREGKGWTPKGLKERFSNPLVDSLFP